MRQELETIPRELSLSGLHCCFTFTMKNTKVRAAEAAQQTKVLSTKPDNLSSIPGTYMVEDPFGESLGQSPLLASTVSYGIGMPHTSQNKCKSKNYIQ